MKTQLLFYPDIEYRTEQVMFEINEHDYGRKAVLHLIYGKEHIPDFYLIDIESSGILLERAVGRYLGSISIDLDDEKGRILKIIGVDLV